MANVQDIAKKAGVGAGTVSRVISGNGYVSDEKRERVNRAIKELHYHPNELARNLLRNKTNIVAVIVPSVANAFFSTLVYYVETTLRSFGYKTMICNTTGEQATEKEFLDMLDKKMVDGILTASHTQDYSIYKKLKRPIVSFDTPILAEEIPVVTSDHKKGGSMAARALINSGCKEVLQFVDESKEDYPFIQRHKEFRKTVIEAGLVCHDYVLQWNDFGRKYEQFVVEDAIKKFPNVDGIFSTDNHAVNYMEHSQALGKRVPQDIKVVAYDGTFILDAVYPKVSAVVQPIEQLAVAGVETLLKRINQCKIEQPVIQLDVEFLQGMTTTGNI